MLGHGGQALIGSAHVSNLTSPSFAPSTPYTIYTVYTLYAKYTMYTMYTMYTVYIHTVQ